MNRLQTALVLIMLGAAPLAGSANQPAPKPVEPPRTALPPPAIEEPGIGTTPPADATGSTIEPDMPDTRPVRDRASRLRKEEQAAAIRASSDSVTRRQEGSDTVEEYREKGRLRMIRIIPRSGPEQMYMDSNGDGRLVRDPLDGPVSPVYFTIYEWK